MIKLVLKTVSLCSVCYRHVPANVYEQDDAVMIAKRCPEHGVQHSMVERDLELFYGMRYFNGHDGVNRAASVLFEITDRCNLKCPHCYHLPDNDSPDRDFDDVMAVCAKIPKNCTPMFAGAEPTMRKDFIKVVETVAPLYHTNSVVTNGIRFADMGFTRAAKQAGLGNVIFGLNHWSYQGQAVHDKQLRAVSNILEVGMPISYLGYTIESLDHLPDIFQEIDRVHQGMILQYRIRCGSFIGRSSDRHRNYVSDTIKKIKSILGDDIEVNHNADNNIYHYNMIWKGRKIRIIQWPDVNNINMEELDCDPYCYFYDGPMTNFVHQVITRDAYINMGMAPKDRVPRKYEFDQYRSGNRPYWRDSWKGIREIDEFDWSYDTADMSPRRIKNAAGQRIIRAVSTG